MNQNPQQKSNPMKTHTVTLTEDEIDIIVSALGCLESQLPKAMRKWTDPERIARGQEELDGAINLNVKLRKQTNWRRLYS